MKIIKSILGKKTKEFRQLENDEQNDLMPVFITRTKKGRKMGFNLPSVLFDNMSFHQRYKSLLEDNTYNSEMMRITDSMPLLNFRGYNYSRNEFAPNLDFLICDYDRTWSLYPKDINDSLYIRHLSDKEEYNDKDLHTKLFSGYSVAILSLDKNGYQNFEIIVSSYNLIVYEKIADNKFKLSSGYLNMSALNILFNYHFNINSGYQGIYKYSNNQLTVRITISITQYGILNYDVDYIGSSYNNRKRLTPNYLNLKPLPYYYGPRTFINCRVGAHDQLLIHNIEAFPYNFELVDPFYIKENSVKYLLGTISTLNRDKLIWVRSVVFEKNKPPLLILSYDAKINNYRTLPVATQAIATYPYYLKTGNRLNNIVRMNIEDETIEVQKAIESFYDLAKKESNRIRSVTKWDDMRIDTQTFIVSRIKESEIHEYHLNLLSDSNAEFMTPDNLHLLPPTTITVVHINDNIISPASRFSLYPRLCYNKGVDDYKVRGCEFKCYIKNKKLSLNDLHFNNIYKGNNTFVLPCGQIVPSAHFQNMSHACLFSIFATENDNTRIDNCKKCHLCHGSKVFELACHEYHAILESQ